MRFLPDKNKIMRSEGLTPIPEHPSPRHYANSTFIRTVHSRLYLYCIVKFDAANKLMHCQYIGIHQCRGDVAPGQHYNLETKRPRSAAKGHAAEVPPEAEKMYVSASCFCKSSSSRTARGIFAEKSAKKREVKAKISPAPYIPWGNDTLRGVKNKNSPHLPLGPCHVTDGCIGAAHDHNR